MARGEGRAATMKREVLPMLDQTLRSLRKRCKRLYYHSLTRISPTLNSRAHYRRTFRAPLDLQNPRTFDEKLMWLKLKVYRDNPLVTRCADKYAVREYLAALGFGHLLNELYAAYDRVEDIRWHELPDAFVMKWNFGCKYTIVCTDRGRLDVAGAVRKLRQWGTTPFHLYNSEMQYRVARKKIVCERYLNPGDKLFPEDYKIYCFNGQPTFVGHFIERSGETLKARAGFFDFDWKPLDSLTRERNPDPGRFARPGRLDEMYSAAKTLCSPFPFVRIDFYEQEDRVIFGEFTFTPSACLSPYFSESGSLQLGGLLALPRS
jgi:hypothetical protein